MSRRHSPQTLQFSAALLGLALLPTTAAATEPTTQQCANLPAPQPTFWPLYERPNGQSAQDFMIDPQDALNGLRNYIWNNFGEFQGSSQNWVPNNYVHTGIDLNAIYSPTGGDFVVVAQSGYIWGAHNFNPVSDGCTHAYNCKLYLRTDDHRYTYYYAHLNVSTLDADHDSQVRAAIHAAAMADNKDTVSLYETGGNPCDPDNDLGCSRVAAGKALSSIGAFDFSHTHLHFSIFDACENYDGLNPLGVYMAQDFDFGYVDDKDPFIETLDLVNSSDQAIAVTDRCTEVAQPFDIVAKMWDVWRDAGDPDLLKLNDRLGVYEASYRLVNLSLEEDSTPVTWYRFDQIPFQCAGENQGEACLPDLDETDLCAEFNIYPHNGNSQWYGPYLARPYTQYMYRDTPNFTSTSRDFDDEDAIYYHSLNHEWGVNSALLSPAGGQYQLTAEAFDIFGQSAEKTIFFQVPSNPAVATGDLLIRDHSEDLGAIPSTLGGKKHFKSSSIRVVPDAQSCPAPGDAAWQTTQWYKVTANSDYKVCVLVENMGCDPIDEFDVQVGETVASMISTNWSTIDVQKTIAGSPAIAAYDPGPMAHDDEVVVSFSWTPATTGHRCLIAGVNSTDNPIKDIPVDMNGLMDFTDPQVNGTDSDFVPWDSNLGQRNVTVSNTTDPFKFGNPFSSAITLAVDIDCNDLPIDAMGSSVTLRMETFGEVEDNWDTVPGTTMTLDKQANISLDLEECKIHFPAITIPANTVVNAWLDVTLPVMYTGTWMIDILATVNGVQRDGITVAHTQ